MSKGALLFAFNSPKFSYYDMAIATAKRINHFLDLPVTVITDESSIPEKLDYTFDKTILVEPDRNNIREHQVWINKGRYQGYALSPYDETILLDTDYMVNSRTLLKTFETYDDFCCHDTTSFLMNPSISQEVLSSYSHRTLWATVMTFRKTPRAKQIFDCMEMVQKNIDHYSNIHSFLGHVFRNDYALTLALRMVNGHSDNPRDIIPWNLVHVGKNTMAYRNTDDALNTSYTILFDHWHRGKIRKEKIIITDTDFHCINKQVFMDLIT